MSIPNNCDDLPLLLCGDFNAWCGNLNKFVNHDNKTINNLSNEIYDNITSVTSLDALGIQTHRMSKHVKTNNYGHRLIQLCKNNNIFMANGRLDKDTCANFTCKGNSIVDYCIMSPNILSSVIKFEVGIFDPVYSDVHNPIHLTLANRCYYKSKQDDDQCSYDLVTDDNMDLTGKFQNLNLNLTIKPK